jgi:hypothetical protein
MCLGRGYEAAIFGWSCHPPFQVSASRQHNTDGCRSKSNLFSDIRSRKGLWRAGGPRGHFSHLVGSNKASRDDYVFSGKKKLISSEGDGV